MLVDGLALDRLLDFVLDNLSPTTVREYRRLLDRRIGPALGERPRLSHHRRP